MKAVKYYAVALKKQKSPSTKALGAIRADDYSEMSSQVSKTWWAKLTPEEKTARAKAAGRGPLGQKEEVALPWLWWFRHSHSSHG